MILYRFVDIFRDFIMLIVKEKICPQLYNISVTFYIDYIVFRKINEYIYYILLQFQGFILCDRKEEILLLRN